jgi:hypothetical protein
MKYVQLLFSALIFSSSCMSGYEIRLLDQKKIKQHATAIEKKVTRDYYVRMALISMVAARIAYAGFKWLNTPVEKPIDLIQQPKKLDVPKITWGQWVCNVKTSWINWGAHLISKENIQNSMINAGKFGLATTFQMGMGSVMQGVYTKLNYPNTFRWYICSHVPYIKTIEYIKTTIATLQDQSLTPEQTNYNKQLLQEACNRFVCDGEKLCGYMTYKTQLLEIEEQQIAERTTRYFCTYYNEFLQRMSDQLACEVVDYTILDTMLASFETDIKRQLKLFFYLEGETDEERAMIGERMKRSIIIDGIAGLF